MRGFTIMVIKLSSDLQQAMNQVSGMVEEHLGTLLLPPTSDRHILAFNARPGTQKDVEKVEEQGSTVLQAMRYSALSGGKRLRPFLVMVSSGLFGVSKESALNTATAIELIHTYSLVHDDLPAMDDDALRRGKPSCHVQFGEAAAILAGDGLLTYAFQLLADKRTHPDPAVRCELITALSQASGHLGMVEGQMMDMEAENEELNADEIIRLQRLKTGELFAVSCETGAILGKSPSMMRSVIRAYAHDLGLAFQITDDLLDAEGTRTKAGKEVKKDKIAGKATLVSVLGTERAREHAKILADQAIMHLSVFDKRADLLRELAKFVINRNF